METYLLSAEDARQLRWKRSRLLLFFGTPLYFAGTLFTTFVWPALRPVDDVGLEILGRAIGACFWGGVMFFLALRPWRETDFKIIVDKSSIKSDHIFPRCVRFDSIQTVIERKPNAFRGGGLFVSDKSHVRAYLWSGGVWIPRELPQYEMLKRAIELRRSPLLEAETSHQGLKPL